MRIVVDDLTHPAVVALLAQHLREAEGNSPAGSVFALDLEGLRDPAVTMFSGWEDGRLLGLAALKALGDNEGEVKSMRTAPDAGRRGVGRAMLAHVVAEARARGYRALRLETGSNDTFAPARALYESAGFVPSEPFGGYVLTDFNRCYVLDLREASGD